MEADVPNLAEMDPFEFEHLIGRLLKLVFPDAVVEVTQQSRDGGIDVRVQQQHELGADTRVVQVKRYTRTVGVDDVKAFEATVRENGASSGFFFTTSGFGPDSHRFVDGKPIELIDGVKLVALLKDRGIPARIDLKGARDVLRAESRR